MPTPMTLQEIFDTSVNHLRKQGRKSVLPADDGYSPVACRYRLPLDDGTCLMCAAGPFITDYVPEMEGNGWHFITERYPENIVPALSERANGLIQRLQNVHDRYPPADWEPQWEAIAYDWSNDVVYTPPTQESADVLSNL